MAKISREPLNFGVGQQSGHEPLSGASPLAINVVVDAAGAVHRRPATAPRVSGTGIVSEVSPIVGLHSTASGRLFAVDEAKPYSRIYEIAGSDVVNLSQVTGNELIGGRRPIFAETEAMLVISTGSFPQKVLLSAPAVSSPLGGGPKKSSHVIAHQGRLLTNNLNDKDEIRYSAQAYGSSIAGHEDWSSINAGFFNADARPDPVVALHENTNEIFAFGTTNLQIFSYSPTVIRTGDQETVLRYQTVNAREVGCSAPYSVVKYDQNFGFIDGHRRIVLTDGREYQFISHDIQQTLDDIPDLSNAFGYRVTIGPVDALCWGMPSDGRTFVYQVPTKSWSIWQGWNDLTNNFAPLPIRCAIRVPETGEMLAGCAQVNESDSRFPVQGAVWALRNDKFIDATTNLGKVVARVDTGFIDQGTSGRKLCRALRLTWKGTPSPDTAAWVQWRDDGGPWEHQRQIEIGYNSEVILRSLGVYRRRQWRVIFQGENELVLARAEEEFELLPV